MAKNVSYNASYHYWGFGIKGEDLDENDFAQYMVSVRGENFESGNNIETEDDTGHTGVANLNMGKYRSSAESEPSWEDRMRFKEGFEDLFYLLLGNYEEPTSDERFKDIREINNTENVKHYLFSFPTVNPKELPSCTIYNGYAKTTDDARVFNNAYLNQLEFNMSNEEAPTVKPSFTSDYNNFNLANPTRNFLAKSSFIKPKQVNIYYGDSDLELKDLFDHKLGCFTESSFTINNNFESVPCQDNEFGKTSKQMGVRETTGSFKLPWNDKTRKLEPEYEGGDPSSHIVSEEVVDKQIAYEFIGAKIDETWENYRCIVHFPVITLTKAESPLSGEDAKDLTIEYEVKETPEQSFMFVDIWTDLTGLHVDEDGCELEDLFDVEETSEEASVTHKLVVRVKDDEGNKIEGATVSIGEDDSKVEDTTNKYGRCILPNVPDNESVTVNVTKEGYAVQEGTNKTPVKGDNNIEITLIKDDSG